MYIYIYIDTHIHTYIHIRIISYSKQSRLRRSERLDAGDAGARLAGVVAVGPLELVDLRLLLLLA